MSGTRKALSLNTTVDAAVPVEVCTFLAEKTGLSKSRVKDAMNKGALLVRRKGRMIRLRRASARLGKNDYLEFHYDEAILSIHPPEAIMVRDSRLYSVWYKPSGLMAQGTLYGDHCSLTRQVELYFRMARPVFLVHRLDREASGIMLMAHSRDAAARLSELFQERKILKEYLSEVSGYIGESGLKGTLSAPLDGKEASTEYEVLSYHPENNISLVKIFIRTGRLHQIRRHFAMLGHPVMGDPQYGESNKNREGLRLAAVSLMFACPFSNGWKAYRLPEGLLSWQER